ncbi:DUF1080 domain-containing protein [Ktedonosporobacter rubrisoli]|uniref:DUF1080 domain-containing protein n=1 Tax=Ktedonosporobacter rubrisoli TaxID=2509675 RepID=A0A4V0YZ74_KTERU|nr:protein kinase [Ktedonosporobacter rubrisoli]QBD78731.1 DUF1080 domain-containing protein [Ktedonosporobacter rubrisoli]
MLLAGQNIDHYHLLQHIGSSNGETYLAINTHTDRQVALKAYRVESLAQLNEMPSQEAVAFFLSRAEALSHLNQVYIAPLYEYGEKAINGTDYTYLVTEYYQNGSLKNWLPSDTDSTVKLRSPLEIARVISQIADALQFAHEQQIIHQNLKPANILFNDSQASPLSDIAIVDFAIITPAARARLKHQLSTDPYLAPEQLTGQSLPATDQYALAAIAYHLLTNTLPFAEDSDRLQLPTPPSKHNSSLPGALDGVLLHALNSKPEGRFPTIISFANAFSEAARVGRDLRSTLYVSPQEARTGTTKTIYLPEGRQMKVALPAGSINGQMLYLEGQGEASPEGPRGDLILTIVIKQPGKDTTPIPIIPEEIITASRQPPDIEELPTQNYRREIEELPTGKYPQDNIEELPTITAIPFDNIQGNTPAGIPFSVEDEPTIKQGRPSNQLLSPITSKLYQFKQAMLPAISQGSHRTFNSISHLTTTLRGNTAQPLWKRPLIRDISLMLLIALILLLSGSIFYTTRVNTLVTQGVNATATAQIQSVSTAYAATYTAQASATAATAHDPYPPNNGMLVFSDSLQARNASNGWNNVGGCSFSNNTYEVQGVAKSSNFCTAGRSFHNFTYEAQIAFTQGGFGGIIFRFNNTKNSYYYFGINTKGGYALLYNTENNYFITILSGGPNQAIKTGQSNTLAVIAKGRQIDLYANGQRLDGVSDALDTEGQIGVAAGDNASDTTTADFNNVKVWNI